MRWVLMLLEWLILSIPLAFGVGYWLKDRSGEPHDFGERASQQHQQDWDEHNER